MRIVCVSSVNIKYNKINLVLWLNIREQNGCEYFWHPIHWFLNPLKPDYACMCQKTRPSLVQILVCCPIDAKPFFEPMLAYWQIDKNEHISMKFDLKKKRFRSRQSLKKIARKMVAIFSHSQCVKTNVFSQYWSERNVGGFPYHKHQLKHKYF